MTREKCLCLTGGAVWRGAGAHVEEGGILIKGREIEARSVRNRMKTVVRAWLYQEDASTRTHCFRIGSP